MKLRYHTCVSVVFIASGWLFGMNQSSSQSVSLPNLQQDFSSAGNPREYFFGLDPCAKAEGDRYIAISVRADFKSVTSDQSLFHLQSEAANLTLELLPGEFHSLVLRIDTPNKSSRELIGKQAWLGEREIFILFRNKDSSLAVGEGINARFVEFMPTKCASIVVGGAPDQGDFQGPIDVSLGTVRVDFDISNVLERSQPNLLANVLQRFLIYVGVGGLLLAGYRWVNTDVKRMAKT